MADEILEHAAAKMTVLANGFMALYGPPNAADLFLGAAVALAEKYQAPADVAAWLRNAASNIEQHGVGGRA